MDVISQPDNAISAVGFPLHSQALESLGMKFSRGGAHVSRTLMLTELIALFRSAPICSVLSDYQGAIVSDNVLGKATDSTRHKSLRHMRELYSLDKGQPTFRVLRKLQAIDPKSLPLLALQIAWSRDPPFAFDYLFDCDHDRGRVLGNRASGTGG
jgi:hypothetical protein